MPANDPTRSEPTDGLDVVAGPNRHLQDKARRHRPARE